MSLRYSLRLWACVLVGSLLFALTVVCTIAFLADHDCSPSDYFGCNAGSAMSSPVAAPWNALAGGSFFLLGDIAVYGLPFLVGGGLLIFFVWGLFVVADQHRDSGNSE